MEFQRQLQRNLTAEAMGMLGNERIVPHTERIIVQPFMVCDQGPSVDSIKEEVIDIKQEIVDS